MSLIIKHLLLIPVLLLGVRAASAQVLYGSIVGNVRDPSQASIPKASVSIRQVETGFTRQGETDDAGTYSFPTIPGGTYELTISKPGFTSFVEADVAVSVNAVTRVDAVLRLGGVTQSLQVAADVTLMQTDRGEVRNEIASKTLEDAPIFPGRNYMEILAILPGFSYPDTENGASVDPERTPIYNVNGASRSSNTVRVEGSGVNQIWLPHLPGITPTLEAIEAVNVASNSFDAETGLAGGAAINVVMKSGTNQLHGVVFWFYNGNATKARPYILPSGQGMPKWVFNQPGGSLGGPILRNRLFYFLSYEATYNRQYASRFETIPTLAIRSGDMSASSRPVYDPTTGDASGSGRTPFPENRIPASRMDPAALKMQNLLPQPTYPTSLSSNLFAQGPVQLTMHRADMKVNWNAISRLTVFGRGAIKHHFLDSPGVLGEALGESVASTFTGNNAGPAWGLSGNMSVGVTYVASPALIFDGNFGYMAYDANSTQPGMGKNLGRDFLGIPWTNGSREFEGGWPRLSVSNYAVLGAAANSTRPFYYRDPRYQFVGNGNWIHGRHNVRFGFDSSWQQMNQTQAEYGGYGASGSFTFDGGPTTVRGGASPNQFNSWAAFLLGAPTTLGRTLQVPDEYTMRTWMHSLYVRDQWQATGKLTVSVGTRWEYFPMPRRVDRGLENYNPDRNTMEICGIGVVPADCGVAQSKRLLSPRVGLAWRPTGGFVVRAGYGISIDPYSLARPMRANYPIVLALGISGPNSYQPAGSLREGIPAVRAPDLANGIISIPATVTATTIDKNFRRGYIQSWNLTIQKKLRWGLVGEAGYVATRQIKRIGYRELNVAPINGGTNGRFLAQRFGRTATTRLVTAAGNTTYDSLQTSLNRRFANGVQMALSYTWSKSIGDCCSFDSGGGPAIELPEYYSLNRSVSSFDRPHSFHVNGIWELPFGRGRRWLSSSPTGVRWIVSGWQINGILSARSGSPFTVSASGTSLNAPGNTQRADQVKKDVAILGGIGSGQSYFDPLAFAPVTEARFGTAGFNRLRGPGAVNLNLGLFRQFRLRETLSMQFRVESFNATNTPHFGNPSANVSNLQLNADGSIRSLGGYTSITATRGGVNGIDERCFRFGIRLSF